MNRQLSPMARERRKIELSAAEVAEAQRLHQEHSLKEVARRMHISVDVIRKALVHRGAAMRSMSSSPWKRRAKRGNAALQRRQDRLRRAVEAGMTAEQMAAEFGVTLERIQKDLRALNEKTS